MSQALAHFSIGFGSFLVLTTLLNIETKPHTLSYAVGSGIFALVPDLHHILPNYSELYFNIFHESIIANLFWGHQIMDSLDPSNSNYVLFLCLMYMCLSVILREISIQQQTDSTTQYTNN